MAAGIKDKFEKCLAQGKIKTFPEAKDLCAKELRVAVSDLEVAKEGLNNGRWKWSTIQSYYSMFHIARALLYSEGYRERSHHCLLVAVEALFVVDGKIPERFVDGLYAAKTMRENADYEEDFSEIGARKLVSMAEELLDFAKRLLGAK
jgi:uncharacterized protein (UPF0332 family)